MLGRLTSTGPVVTIRTLVLAGLALLAVVAGVLMAWSLLHVVLLVLTAVVLGEGLRPAIDRSCRRGMPYGLSIAVVYLALIAVLLAILAVLIVIGLGFWLFSPKGVPVHAALVQTANAGGAASAGAGVGDGWVTLGSGASRSGAPPLGAAALAGVSPLLAFFFLLRSCYTRM